MKICLIGSSRFKQELIDVNVELTGAGHIVYTLAFYGHAESVRPSNDLKETLDLVHLAKILESDLVVAVTGEENYIGDSTRREIKWAAILGKRLFFWRLPEHRSQLLSGGSLGLAPVFPFRAPERTGWTR